MRWHSYDSKNLDQIQLTLYFHCHRAKYCASLYPGEMLVCQLKDNRESDDFFIGNVVKSMGNGLI